MSEYGVGDHVEIIHEEQDGYITAVRMGVFDRYYMVRCLDGLEREFDSSEIRHWTGQ